MKMTKIREIRIDISDDDQTKCSKFCPFFSSHYLIITIAAYTCNLYNQDLGINKIPFSDMSIFRCEKCIKEFGIGELKNEPTTICS